MITVIGSLNYDLIVRMPRFPTPGETIIGRDFATACGGKGANQAYATAKLRDSSAQQPVVMLGCIGDDAAGEALIKSLESAGANTQYLIQRKQTPSGIAMILVADNGQNEIIIASGANMTFGLDDVKANVPLIQQSSHLISQLEIPLESVQFALNHSRAAGVTTVVNPAPYHPDVVHFLPLCDIVIPNETEAAQLCNLPVVNLANAANAASAIQQLGARNVIITLGENGAWLHTTDWSGHVPTPKVDVVDTTAAGDTFIGAFVLRLSEGAGFREAAHFACKAAAISVTRPGAQPSVPTRAEVLGLK
jgi:ribokinase